MHLLHLLLHFALLFLICVNYFFITTSVGTGGKYLRGSRILARHHTGKRHGKCRGQADTITNLGY